LPRARGDALSLGSRQKKTPGRGPALLTSSYSLPAIAADADAHADAGGANADARARFIITAVGAALVIALARCIVVGVAHDDAGAATAAIAVAVFVADHPDLLHQIGVGIPLRNVDVRRLGGADGKRRGASQQRDCECLHHSSSRKPK